MNTEKTKFDFNINNYTISDIENFLGLIQNYTFNDIMQRKENVVNIIINNKQHDKTYRKKLVEFTNDSVIKLVDNIKNTSQQQNGFIEDYDELLIEKDEGKVVNQTSTTYAGHNFVMNKNTVELDDILGKNQRVNPIETFPTNIARSNLNVIKRKTFNQTVMMNTLFREEKKISIIFTNNLREQMDYYFLKQLLIQILHGLGFQSHLIQNIL